MSATQAESRSIEEEPVSQGAAFPGIDFPKTSVGHTEKKLVEGKDIGLPMKRESPRLQDGECQYAAVKQSTPSGRRVWLAWGPFVFLFLPLPIVQ